MIILVGISLSSRLIVEHWELINQFLRPTAINDYVELMLFFTYFVQCCVAFENLSLFLIWRHVERWTLTPIRHAPDLSLMTT